MNKILLLVSIFLIYQTNKKTTLFNDKQLYGNQYNILYLY